MDILETLALVAKGAEILGLLPDDVRGNARLMELCIEAALAAE